MLMPNRYASLVGSNKIRDEYQKINIGFDRVQQEIDAEVAAREALDQRVDTIIQGGGPDKDAELVDIRTPDPSYTPGRVIAVAGDAVRDIQAQFMSHKAETVTHVFNVKTGFGAKGNGVTDDTQAILNAINAAAAAGGGTVYFPKGHYIIAGELLNPDMQNAQIPLPTVSLSDPQVYIALVGEETVKSYAQYSSVAPTRSGVILESTLTNASGHFPAVIGASRPDKEFTNITAVIKNICIRTPNNPTLSALQLHGVVNAIVEDVCVDVNASTLDILEPTNYMARGLILPRWGNDGTVSVNRFYALGYYVGLHFAEHAKIKDTFIQNCKIAMYPEVRYGHASHIYHILVQSCPYVIAQPVDGGVTDLTGPTYPMPLFIDMLDVEDYNPNIPLSTGPWPAVVKHIADQNNMLSGHVNYFLSGSTNINLIVSGAGGLKIRHFDSHSRYNPNLLFNPTGELGLAGWTPFGQNPENWFATGAKAEGPIFSYAGINNTTALPAQANMVSEKIPALANSAYSIQAEANTTMLTAGAMGVQVEAYDASGTFLQVVAKLEWTGADKIFTPKHKSFTTPANTDHLRVIQFVSPGTMGAYGPIMRRIYLHFGLYAQDYDDQGTFNTLTYPGMFAQYVNNSPTTIVNGKTSGTIEWVQDLRATVKRVVINFTSYVNSSGTADVIVFPKAFRKTPIITANSANISGVTLSATQISINPNNSTTYNGYIIIEGF